MRGVGSDVSSSPLLARFDPVAAEAGRRTVQRWVDYRGRPIDPSALPLRSPTAEDVAQGRVGQVQVSQIAFRDPDTFISGQIHNFVAAWEDILPESPLGEDVSRWVKGGVDIAAFFQPFKGRFRGREFNSPSPQAFIQRNSPLNVLVVLKVL